MTTTILQVTGSTASQAAGAALREAGLGFVEVHDWKDAQEAVRRGDASLLICDRSAVEALGSGSRAALSNEAARELSHELRTPLSAMAGWLHLLESGKLDPAGTKRAIEKLRGNIDDQVRTIERFLGTRTTEGASK